MSRRALIPVVFLLVLAVQGTGFCQEQVSSAAEGQGQVELGKQLKINRDSLLEGSSEQGRIDAATVMLYSEEAMARDVLLDALKQRENPAALVAVCKALIQSRAAEQSIVNKADFIEPMLGLLMSEDFAQPRLVAEAMLIFDYNQIARRLEEIVTDDSLPSDARINGIGVLELQPDMRALFQIIRLLDDPDAEVASASKEVLHSLGIVVGQGGKSGEEIITELKQKGEEEFIRDWLIRLEDRIRSLQKEVGLWQQMYLSALDRIYEATGEDAERAKFLAEQLKSSKAVVRLWSLGKVSQWRMGTTSKLPAALGPVLIDLISDQSREVRLKTAQLLSLMGDLNSAQRLLEQLKVEQDEQVRMELFVALGGACYYAFLPNSGVQVPADVRKQTLEWAVQYLEEPERAKCQRGGEVLRKLLEQDDLGTKQVERYLSLLAKRYQREKDGGNSDLRGELLSIMSGLCAQGVHKARAAELFRPLFEGALGDEKDLTRQAAVNGLIYIDKSRALKVLRETLVNDSNPAVREKVIRLAGEVGGARDLVWLGEKVGPGEEGGAVWQEMLKIFRRSSVDVLGEWMERLKSGGKVSDEQRITFLEIARQKTLGEKKVKMLESIREELARLYSKNGEYEQAAEYLGKLRQTAGSNERKQAVAASLFQVYLKWQNVERATELVNNLLLERDLDANDVVVRCLNEYVVSPPAQVDPNVVLDALAKTDVPENRPMWHKQLQRWSRYLKPRKDSEKAAKAKNN